MPGLVRIAARRHALVNRHFGGLLEQGRAAGSIRGDVPIGFIVDVFMATVNEIGRPEKVDELGMGPREIFSNLTSLLIEGVLTDKGRSRWNAFKLSTAKSDAAATAAAPRRAASTLPCVATVVSLPDACRSVSQRSSIAGKPCQSDHLAWPSVGLLRTRFEPSFSAALMAPHSVSATTPRK